MSLAGYVLEYPIPAATRHQIAHTLWDSEGDDTLGSYFQYYTEQCRIVLYAHGWYMRKKCHQEIVDIAQKLRADLCREEIQVQLLANVHKPTSIASGQQEVEANVTSDGAIDLAVRLLLMLDVGELPNTLSGRRQLVWDNGRPLKDFVRDTFPEKVTLGHDGVRLGPEFTARNLDRMTGFRVELTTNLADHLRFRHDDKTVSIFYHASFLRLERKSKTSLFPDGFVEETLRTIALLFPSNRDTEKWYYKQLDLSQLDPGALKCGHFEDESRRIETYRFWHDRLVVLKQEFDESPPTNLTQLWNDRRLGSQWYALWVAIGITLFFGLVQSIEGAIQVYKAY
ncbi:hypothetical protein VTL71DRAFT_5438 [Oculimacula yallundae]|uniref:Uncharacterized protein n=1 Tax=Oculimacula yallundae TaxID=86028 RepID=A0ABR4C122_9HELO